MNAENPYDFCTLDDTSDCSNCGIEGRLVCKWDENIKNNFRAIGFPSVVIPSSGMILIGLATGAWWPLIVYVLYFMSMFSVFEIRFLCSHCPYYSDKRKFLKCLGNHGSPKLWKYHPEPMNGFEKLMMRFGVIAMIFYIFPLTFLGYGVFYFSMHYSEFGLLALSGMIALLLASFMTSRSFVSTLKTFYCTRCVNFSCPLNTVPVSVVDEYLKRNPTMRDAWEKSGYRIGR